MAAHDITQIAERVLALGGTEEEILACGRVDEWAGSWRALNRSAEYAVRALCATLEARSRQAAPSAGQAMTPADRARRAGARLGISGEIWD